MPCLTLHRKKTKIRTRQILKRVGSCSRRPTESTSSQATDKSAPPTTSWSRETPASRRLLPKPHLPTLSAAATLSAWCFTKRRKAVKRTRSCKANSSSHNKKRIKLRKIKQPRVELRGRRRLRNRYSRGKLTLCSSFPPSTFTSTLCQTHSIKQSRAIEDWGINNLSSMDMKLIMTYFN